MSGERDKMELHEVKGFLLDICNDPREFTPAFVSQLCGDAHFRIEELQSQLLRQRGKVDLESAHEIAKELSKSIVHIGTCRSTGFGSQTIKFLIEELEWRRNAMHDPNDGDAREAKR